MKTNIAIVLLIVFILASGGLMAQQERVYPVIKNYGSITPLPNAAVQPDKSLEYKVLFDVRKAADKKDQVNPGLFHIARFINVFASGGIMPDKMKMVAVIHGEATAIVLKNEIYQQKYGCLNPNTQLINDLKNNGVEIYVCGQALADNDFKQDWVNPDIVVALSAMTVLPTYQLKGYALIQF